MVDLRLRVRQAQGHARAFCAVILTTQAGLPLPGGLERPRTAALPSVGHGACWIPLKSERGPMLPRAVPFCGVKGVAAGQRRALSKGAI